jgi:signal peptidase I
MSTSPTGRPLGSRGTACRRRNAMSAAYAIPVRIGRLRRVPGVVAIAAALAVAAVTLVPGALGYGRHVITGDSMGESIPRGSLVYERQVPTSKLEVGDVITYTPPPGAGPRGPVTHRIAWIGRGRDGALAFRTKGDSNTHADPWRSVLDRATQAKVVMTVPFAGWPLAALGERRVRMLAIGVPALLVALACMTRLRVREG